MFFNRQVVKKTVVHANQGLLLGNKNELFDTYKWTINTYNKWTINTYNNLDECPGNYAEWKKSIPKSFKLHDYIYITFYIHFIYTYIYFIYIYITFLNVKIIEIENSHSYGVRRRRQWHPTSVLLPGKSQGQRSLVGCSPWGR